VEKILEGTIRPTQLLAPEGKSEKGTVVGLHDAALVLVDHQLELTGQEARDACHDPLARPVALDQDQQIVRVAHEPVSPALQLLVQVIQQDVGEQRRKHASDAKGNFVFERKVVLDRKQSVLDLRRKR